MYIQVKDLPSVIISQLSGIGYACKDIKVQVTESIDLFCSGGNGSRGFAIVVNLDTGETKRFTGSWGGANMFNPSNRVDVDTSSHVIPLNGAVIKGSEGNRVYATVYVSASNIVKALQSPVNELSPNEKGLLKCFSSIKSSYRKEYIFGGYSRDYFANPLTETEYKETVDSLALKGLVKVTKAGSVSLTTNGKNV